MALSLKPLSDRVVVEPALRKTNPQVELFYQTLLRRNLSKD